MDIEPCFISLHEKLSLLIHSAVNKGIFPGAAIGIAVQNPSARKRYLFSHGKRTLLPAIKPLKKEVCFDLASLTKPLAATLAVLSLLKENKITLNDTLAGLLERDVPHDKRDISLFHLLNHCSGLPGHRFYYRKLMDFSVAKRRSQLLRQILAEPLEYEIGSTSVYSDLGFMLLSEIIEIKSLERIDKYVEQRILEPLGLEHDLFFNPVGEMKKRRYAATEKCAWRKKILCGEVHDQNCYALGGVCGHAGLFGTINGVLTLVSCLHDIWQGRGDHPSFRAEDLRTFFKRQKSGSSWGLGFDTPSSHGSSGGRFISTKSAGHLGFTGTSFWIDMERQLVIVLLTNRIHPRVKEGIKAFRPLFHDSVIKTLDALDKGLK